MSSVTACGLFATGLLLPALGVTAVSLRYAARHRRQHGFEMDDYLCIPAALMLIACGIISMVGSGQKVLGQPDTTDVNPSHDMTVQQMGIAFDILQTFCLTSIKLSIIFLYRRTFPGRGFNLACHFVAGFVVQWFLSFIISIIVFGIRRLQHPHQSPNDFTANNSFVNGLLIILSVESVLVNIALYILPITVLRKMFLPLPKMLKAVGIFLVAAAAIVFGILQLALPVTAQNDPEASALDLATGIAGTEDVVAVSTYMFWGLMQMGFLLTAICLPTFGLFFEKMPRSLPWPRTVQTGMNKPLPKLPADVKRHPRPSLGEKHERRPSEMSDYILANSHVGQGFRRPSEASRSIYELAATPHIRNPSTASAHIRQTSMPSQNFGQASEHHPYQDQFAANPYRYRHSHNSTHNRHSSTTAPAADFPLAPRPLFSATPSGQAQSRRTSDASRQHPPSLQISIPPPVRPSTQSSPYSASQRNAYRPQPTAYSKLFVNPSGDGNGVSPSSKSTTPVTASSQHSRWGSEPIGDTRGAAPYTAHMHGPSDPLNSNPNPFYNPSSASRLDRSRRPSAYSARSIAGSETSSPARRPSAALAPPGREADALGNHSRSTSEPQSQQQHRRPSEPFLAARPTHSFIRKTSAPSMAHHTRSLHSLPAPLRRPSESLAVLPGRNMSVPDADMTRDIEQLAPHHGSVEARVSPQWPAERGASWFRDPSPEKNNQSQNNVPEGSIMVQNRISQKVELV